MNTQLAPAIELTEFTLDLTELTGDFGPAADFGDSPASEGIAAPATNPAANKPATQPDSNPDIKTRKTATMFQLLDHKTPDWFINARCADGVGTFAWLFFSEDLSEIARAKAICANCPVREPCLDVAVERRESWGVWGGELLMNGKVLAAKRRRGRPPKVAPIEIVIDELGEVISA